MTPSPASTCPRLMAPRASRFSWVPRSGMSWSRGHQLDRAVDFGWFWFIAVPLLWSAGAAPLIPNYGVDIILLTDREAGDLPAHAEAFKSMKAMQKLQPEMQRLRERYKDDQARCRRRSWSSTGGTGEPGLRVPADVATASGLRRPLQRAACTRSSSGMRPSCCGSTTCRRPTG